MVSIQNVSKRFGSRQAVERLSLEVPRGSIFGLLGHNGAGKSTLIGMLLGQVYPDEGKALIDGKDVFLHRARALARVGAIFEAPAFYDYLSALANLRIFCEYSGPVETRRMEEVIQLVGLKDRIHDRVSVYSHGMRQRLALAQALLPHPDLLILDEPSDGLDPEGIHEMRNLILKLNREWGLTILFSSHMLHEVQRLCSDLAVMRKGRLLFSGKWRELGMNDSWIKLRVDRPREAEAGLIQSGLIREFGSDERGMLAPGADTAGVADWLVRHGFKIAMIAPAERALEDFYMNTVGIKNEIPSTER